MYNEVHGQYLLASSSVLAGGPRYLDQANFSWFIAKMSTAEAIMPPARPKPARFTRKRVIAEPGAIKRPSGGGRQRRVQLIILLLKEAQADAQR
ncbi:hypothetical protein TYRP_009639 [Tyrophagus putrescentiae]|nr:hypothetical protein TYRP_009639 [Tyrophagus putrescentiae]